MSRQQKPFEVNQRVNYVATHPDTLITRSLNLFVLREAAFSANKITFCFLFPPTLGGNDSCEFCSEDEP